MLIRVSTKIAGWLFSLLRTSINVPWHILGWGDLRRRRKAGNPYRTHVSRLSPRPELNRAHMSLQDEKNIIEKPTKRTHLL